MMSPKKQNSFNRVLSLATLLVFAASSIVNDTSSLAYGSSITAAPSRQPRRSFQSENYSPHALTHWLERLPSDLAYVRQMEMNSEAPLSKGFILHIQDAHANPSAQENIARLLRHLYEQFPDMTVGVEGAEGAIHPEFFDFFPPYPKAGDAVVQDLLKKGLMSGAELFAWQLYRNSEKQNNADKETGPFITGIEDAKLYQENLRAYQWLDEHRDEIEPMLQKMRASLTASQTRIMSGELLGFLKERDRRRNGKLNYGLADGHSDIASYIGYLNRQSERYLDVRLLDPIEQLRFPNLVRAIQLQDDEKKFNRSQASKEWQTLLQQVRAQSSRDWERALSQSLDVFAVKQGLVNPGKAEGTPALQGSYPRRLLENLYAFSQAHQLTLEEYPQVLTAFRLFVFQAEIQTDGLFEEIDRLETGIIEKLAVSPDEKLLARRLENLGLAEKLLRLELTRGELQKVRERFPEIREWVERPGNQLSAKILEAFRYALYFYRTALKRDSVLIRQALKIHDPAKRPILVIIEGGFHTDGLTDEIRAQKIPYAVAVPRFGETEAGQRLYRDAMSGKYADVEAYFHGANPFSSKRQAILFRELIETGIPALMKEYALKDDALADLVQKTVQENKVFADKLQAQFVEEEKERMIQLNAKWSPPLPMVSKATLQTPLLSSQEDLTNSYQTPTPVVFGINAQGHVEIQRPHPATVSTKGLNITHGVLTPAQSRQGFDLSGMSASVNIPGITDLFVNPSVVRSSPVAASPIPEQLFPTVDLGRAITRHYTLEGKEVPPFTRDVSGASQILGQIVPPTVTLTASYVSQVLQLASTTRSVFPALTAVRDALGPFSSILDNGPIHLVVVEQNELRVQDYQAAFLLLLRTGNHISIVMPTSPGKAAEAEALFRSEARKYGITADNSLDVIGAGSRRLWQTVLKVATDPQYRKLHTAVVNQELSSLGYAAGVARLLRQDLGMNESLVGSGLYLLSEKIQPFLEESLPSWMNRKGINLSELNVRISQALAALKKIAASA